MNKIGKKPGGKEKKETKTQRKKNAKDRFNVKNNQEEEYKSKHITDRAAEIEIFC